jgi:hypothetical protein
MILSANAAGERKRKERRKSIEKFPPLLKMMPWISVKMGSLDCTLQQQYL